MKAITYKSRDRSVMIALTLSAILVLGAVGCARRSTIQVVPVSNRHVLELNADDVVQVMRRAGFSDTQILEHGPDLHSGLAESGAVQIKIKNTVEAVFAINGDSVYISTRLRGHFIYNVNTGWTSGG
ncbi:MAG: hypothetical protein ABIF19_11120 [Planctomycetota bacterium]